MMAAAGKDPYDIDNIDNDYSEPLKVVKKVKKKSKKERVPSPERPVAASCSPSSTKEISPSSKKRSHKKKDDVSGNRKMTDYFPLAQKSPQGATGDAPAQLPQPIESEVPDDREVEKIIRKKKKKKTSHRENIVEEVEADNESQDMNQNQNQPHNEEPSTSRKEKSKDKVAKIKKKKDKQSRHEDMELEQHEKVEQEVKPTKKEKSDLSTQSTHQLLMNPNILTAGCVLLESLKSNKMSAEEVGKKIGLKKGPRLRSHRDDQDDHNEEITSKRKGADTKDNQKHPDPRSDPEDSLDNSRPGDESNDSFDGSHTQGLAVLRELIKRSAVNMSEDINVDGDLNDGLSGDLFQDFAAKKKMVLAHTKTIQKLSPLELRSAFAMIVGEVAKIYNGSHHSIRHEKFKQGRAEERSLKDLLVTYPFNQVQSGNIIDLVFDSFFEDKSRRYNWSNYVNSVLVPETFIRIYAYVNKIDNASAEKEMLYSEAYEGPVNTKLRKHQRKARENELLELASSRESQSTAESGDTNTNGNADNEDSINDVVSEMHLDGDADASNSSIDYISAVM